MAGAIATLKAMLGLDTGDWERGLQKGKQQASKFSEDVKKIFAGVTLGGLATKALEKTLAMLGEFMDRERGLEMAEDAVHMADALGINDKRFRTHPYVKEQIGGMVKVRLTPGP
jgi:hypothetical protein